MKSHFCFMCPYSEKEEMKVDFLRFWYASSKIDWKVTNRWKIGKTKVFWSLFQQFKTARQCENLSNIIFYFFLLNIFELPLIHDHCLLGWCGLKLLLWHEMSKLSLSRPDTSENVNTLGCCTHLNASGVAQLHSYLKHLYPEHRTIIAEIIAESISGHTSYKFPEAQLFHHKRGSSFREKS